MNPFKALARFWYGFMVGDEWRIAAGVIVSASLILALVHIGMDPWPLFVLMVTATMALVLRRAIQQTQHNEQQRAHIVSLAGSWVRLWLPLVLLALLPVLSAYLKNTSETSIQDLLLPLALGVIQATIVGSIFFRGYLKERFTFYLAAIFFIILVANNYGSKSQWVYNLINSVWPFQLAGPIVGLGYLALLGYATYRLGAWINRQAVQRHWRVDEIMIAGTITIATTFALQFIPAASNIASAWPQFFYQPPKLAAPKPTAAELADKPDVYYIDMEDYASQQTLTSQMNFDNGNFLQYLAGNGFYNVPAASSNYPYTVNSVASVLNGDYLSDAVNRFSGSANQTMIPYFDTARNSPVVQQFKALGYHYDLLGDWYETSNYSPLADHNYTDDNEVVAFNHTYSLDDFTDTQLQNNVFWPLIHAGISLGHFRLLGYNTQDTASLTQNQLTQLQKLAGEPAGGRFIFAQILLPHNYYYYNADGSLNNNAAPDNNGEPVEKKYTNEAQYINSRIEPILDEIKTKSQGKAVVVLQSDEGPAPLIMNQQDFSMTDFDKQATQGNMHNWSQADLQMKYGIQAAYYVPGAPADQLAAAATPINIFRLVLNTYFNNQLPYLPSCYYGFPQGTNESFVYQGVDTAITGQPNANCPQNGNFIKPGATKLSKSKVHSTSTSADDD